MALAGLALAAMAAAGCGGRTPLVGPLDGGASGGLDRAVGLDFPVALDAADLPVAFDLPRRLDVPAQRDLPADVPPDLPELVGCSSSGPTVLATAPSSVTAIAVDGTHVYWAASGDDCQSGQIQRISKGGGQVDTLADAQSNPRAMVLDDTSAYFYNGCGSGQLRRVPLGGGPIFDYAVQVSLQEDARVVAVDSQNVYFNDYGVLRVPKAGGQQTEVDEQDFVYALAADDGGVFWTGPIGGFSPFGIFAWHPGDAMQTLLGMSDGVGNFLVIDPQALYFVSSDATGAFVARMDRGGGAPVNLAPGSEASLLAVDDTFLYWSDYTGDGTFILHKVPKQGGGAPIDVASGQGTAQAMAVDDHCLYLATHEGPILSLPK
jgi:hypothetical protein